MGSGEIVEAFPFSQLLVKIDIISVSKQLVDFLLICPVRAFDLAIQLRRTSLDIGMADALIFDVPMEPGLEFVAIVGAHFPDPERKPGDDVVDEGNRVGLGMSVIDFERSDTGRIINGGVLVALDRLSVFIVEGQRLDVDLDLMARDLVLIPLGVDLADARPARKPVQAMPPENAIDPGIRDFDAVIAGEVPDDPDGPQMISLPQK